MWPNSYISGQGTSEKKKKKWKHWMIKKKDKVQSHAGNILANTHKYTLHIQKYSYNYYDMSDLKDSLSLFLHFTPVFFSPLALYLSIKYLRHCSLWFGNNHQNRMEPQLYLHPTLLCGIAAKTRYDQNFQTRGIMPCNVCLAISWLLQTSKGDVNVICQTD